MFTHTSPYRTNTTVLASYQGTTDPSPIQNVLENYLLVCKVEEKSPLTIASYNQRLTYFFRWMELGITLEKIDRRIVRMYLLSLQEKKQEPSYINAQYRAINTFFKWCISEGYLNHTPMENVKPPRMPKKKPQPFSQGDIDRLILCTGGHRFVDVRNRAIVLMFLDTGLRLCELSNIKSTDIDREFEVIKVMGKGAKERVVRLGKNARKALIKYLMTRREYSFSELWLSEDRKPLTRGGVKIMVQDLCHRAGITDAHCGPHTFRHTFAIRSFENGAREFEVQAILGHATLTMTRHYMSTLNSEKALNSHKTFSPGDSLEL